MVRGLLGRKISMTQAFDDNGRAVAVLLDGSQANHGAGAGLENGDRQELTLLGEHLGHPDLLGQQSLRRHG